jgi:hypothetical protein
LKDRPILKRTYIYRDCALVRSAPLGAGGEKSAAEPALRSSKPITNKSHRQ